MRPVTFLSSALLFFSLICVSPDMSGQTVGRDGFSLKDLQSLKSEGSRPTLQTDAGAVPVDSPIDPEEYVLGPGDILSLNVWSSSPVEARLTVTPEGTLIIPAIGVTDVRRLTLAQAKRAVKNIVGRRYIGEDISLTLLAPRKVAVEIFGFVLNEGKKEAYSVQRVDRLIAQSNTFPSDRLTTQEYAAELQRVRTESSERNIILRRKDGTTQRVDLAKFRITGQSKYNPYLQEGDVVYVARRDDMRRSIGLYGGFAGSSDLEFVPGDSLLDLVAMGFGLGLVSRSDSMGVLTRLSGDGSTMEQITVDLPAVLRGRAHNIPLQAGDRLLLQGAKKDDRQNYRVQIEGEVMRPGVYPISRDRTTLSEIVRAAGGFTSHANLHAATVTRHPGGDKQLSDVIQREAMLSQRSSIDPGDSAYYNIEAILRISGENVSVDFPKLFEAGDSTEDITLRTFDHIYVPAKNRSVYVFGQVRAPGYVPFREGEDLEYFVDLAGGFALDARSGDARVIKGGSRAWLDPDETVIEDGDLIWVPRDQVHPFSYYVTVYTQIASIIGVVATVALLINSLK